MTHEFLQKVHDPHAKHWEGFCDQWTAAALNPQINRFISSTQGLICNEIYISEGELEELFTLFYLNFKTQVIAGKKANRLITANDQILRNGFGIDDLNPYDFHKNIVCNKVTLVILLLCLQTQFNPAQSMEKATYCVQIFQKLNDEIQLGYIHPLTKEKVDEYFSDRTLTPQERASKAFIAVTSDRLKILPKKDADTVIRFFEEGVVRNYVRSANLINGTFSDIPFQKYKILISVPENFLEDIIE